MRSLDLIVIAAYLAGLVAIGLRFARRQRTTEQYFVAGRSVPGLGDGPLAARDHHHQRHLHRLSGFSLCGRLVVAGAGHPLRRRRSDSSAPSSFPSSVASSA